MTILKGIFSGIGIGIGAGARLRALELILNEGVKAVFRAKIGYSRVSAYAGTGDDDHLARLGERVGDILEELYVVGLNLERGHVLRGGGCDLEGGRGEPTSARSMWKTSSTRTLKSCIYSGRRCRFEGAGGAWIGS